MTHCSRSGKRNVSKKSVPLVPLQELSSWPTKRLLGRLNALRKLEESPERSDVGEGELDDRTGLFFKSDPRWTDAYKELKSVLDNRENIRSGRADRLARIKANR